jgi:ABC-type multidrug transport system ATPase subunit
VVDCLTLGIACGEIVGLVGRNGAGKTTSIRIGVGVATPSGGDVHVDGISLTGEKATASELIGWVPEESVHDEDSRVASLLRYYEAMAASSGRSHCEQMLLDWGLAEFQDRRVRTLSLGMKRRLSIIAAELGTPKYFLLDEVFNGLDPEGVASVRKWMKTKRSEGCGLLISSHNLRELAALTDRIAILHKGRLLRTLASAELRTRPARRIRLTIPRLDPNGLEVLANFGEVERTPDGAIVRGDSLDAAEMNRAMVSSGYSIAAIESADDPLESMFLEMIEGAG